MINNFSVTLKLEVLMSQNSRSFKEYDYIWKTLKKSDVIYILKGIYYVILTSEFYVIAFDL